MNESEQEPHPSLAIVVAMGRRTRVIGRNNQLLWAVPDNLRRFSSQTRGKPVIMGRKTFQSIVEMIGRPLPSRPNIVVTRDPAFAHTGAHVTNTLEKAIRFARSYGSEEIHIGGGEEIYRQVFPLVNRLYVTLFNDDPPGDTFFPEYDAEFRECHRHEPREYKGLGYEWIDLVRTQK